MFQFLKYIQPTSYFSLKAKGELIFPNPDLLPAEIINQLIFDNAFSSNKSSKADLSWQAIQNGYIGDCTPIILNESIPIQDEYRFIRKYFNKVWALYCLFIRLLSFKNPFVEVTGWYKSIGVTRVASFEGIIISKEELIDDFQLLHKRPKISVIIPTLNRYDFLKDILADFEKQDYKNFEIIVVDQSDNFSTEFYKNFNLDINLIRQEEKALWLARNTAIKKSKGSYIALSEDDVRIESNWLTEHIKCLDLFSADISAGVFYSEGYQIPIERSFFAVAKQFATGNALLKKEVFYEVGLFDRQFEKGRMGDGEFGLRCYIEGFKCVSNPKASCIDVKASSGGLREMGSWDAYRPTKWLSPRPVPSVLYYYRKYFGNKSAFFELLKTIPTSITPYKFKKNKKLKVIGLLLSLLIFPIIIYQVWKSWHLASIKLKQGSSIENLLKFTP
jgi:glycosyltransferase involved in cell wall biosynthesis